MHAQVGMGEGDVAEGQVGAALEFGADARLRRGDREARALVLDLCLIVSNCPGLTNPRILASLIIARNGMRSNLVRARRSQPELCAIASVKSTPGMIG